MVCWFVCATKVIGDTAGLGDPRPGDVDRARVHAIQRRAMIIISLEVHRQRQQRSVEAGGLIRFHGILPPGEVNILLVLLRCLQLLLVLWIEMIIRGRYNGLRGRRAAGNAQESTAFG